MLTRLRIRSNLFRSLALATCLASAAAGMAMAANPNQTFAVTACATRDDEFHIVGTWSGFRVAAWSFFIESSEGSGGTFQPLPEPVRSGVVSQTSGPIDATAIQSVSITLYRTAGSNPSVAATQTLIQPASGWPSC
jgi:hypothetical protein